MIAIACTLLLGWQDATEQVNALWKEYNSARDAFARAVRAARDPDERQRIRDEENPAAKFLPRFRELAARTPSDGAHFAVFNLALEVNDSQAAKESAHALLKSNPSQPMMREVARELQYAHLSGWKWAREWLRSAIEASGNRDVKTTATYSLGFTISSASGTTPAEREEAKGLLRALVRDFEGSEDARRAARLLFELENLAIGCTAPDFEAKDVEGKSFKLSDYRGKVVVVSFWGFW